MTRTFDFRFTPAYAAAGLPFGVTARTARVEVDGADLHVRFGPWRVRTTLANIASTSRTGPYSFLRTAGPAHLSFADRGMTCATNGDAGLCLTFRTPVRGLDPTGRLRHPGLTLTVADLDGLAAAVA